MKIKNNLTAVYVRVSTKKQNISSQKNKLISFCKRNKWKYRTYIDEQSGTSIEKRKELKRLLKDLDSGVYNRVLLYSIDRLTRNFYDAVRLEKFFTRLWNTGCKLISYAGNIDLGSPMGRAMFRVSLVFSALDYETRRQKCKDGLEEYWSNKRGGKT